MDLLSDDILLLCLKKTTSDMTQIVYGNKRKMEHIAPPIDKPTTCEAMGVYSDRCMFVCKRWSRITINWGVFAPTKETQKWNVWNNFFQSMHFVNTRHQLISMHLDGQRDINGLLLRVALPNCKHLKFLSVRGCGLAPAFLSDLPLLARWLSMVDITDCATIHHLFSRRDGFRLIQNVTATGSVLSIITDMSKRRCNPPPPNRCYRVTHNNSLYYVINQTACTCGRSIRCSQKCFVTGADFNEIVYCNRHHK